MPSAAAAAPTGADVRYVLTAQGVEALDISRWREISRRVALTPRGVAWLRWYTAAAAAGLSDDQAQVMAWRAAECTSSSAYIRRSTY